MCEYCGCQDAAIVGLTREHDGIRGVAREAVRGARDDDRPAAAAAAQLRGAADWPRRLNAALTELFSHILREQDGLFPATPATLTPHSRARVARWVTLPASLQPHTEPRRRGQ